MRKKIKNDIYNKGDDYRFNEKKIQPCYNEVELKYHNEKESELSNKDEENKRELKSMSYKIKLILFLHLISVKIYKTIECIYSFLL